MLRKLDQIIDSLTMYRLVTYVLFLLVIASMVFSMTGLVGYCPLTLGISLTIMLGVGYVMNQVFGWIWRVPTNAESGLITSLILFLILQPATTTLGYAALALAATLGIATKFMIAYRGKHIFNPAALAAAIIGWIGVGHATWWVGSSAMWPFVLVLGLLVIRKLRKGYLFGAFVLATVITAVAVGLSRNVSPISTLELLLTTSPLLFLGTIMLTEPATMPPRHNQQILFAAGVGVLYAAQLQVGWLYILPEVALLIGNLYAFMVSPKRRWILTLKRVERVSDKVSNYVFQADAPLSFQAGQYMEWTLPHAKMDDRGNRRSFTLASAPTEQEVHLGVKFHEPSSSYKLAMQQMQPGESMFVGQVSGSFTMPRNRSTKLLFIAGGIGITPFRSMIQEMIITGKVRDVVLVYAATSANEFAYMEVFQAASKQGIKVFPVIGGRTITSEFLQTNVPDIAERLSYISGPQPMVESAKVNLRAAGVPRSSIKCDYFSGY